MILSNREPNILQVAGDIVELALSSLAEKGFANKNAGSLIVMDFADGFRRPPEGKTIKDVVENEKLFNDYYSDLIVHQQTYNADNSWKQQYEWNARAKALMAGRDQMPTDMLLQHAPFFVQPGDSRYQGGMYLHGIAGGFSGVQAEWDEALISIFFVLMFADAQTEVRKTSEDAYF